MSYGVWKNRGKGWSSIEVDSPWNSTLYDLKRVNERAARRLEADCEREGVSEDNPHIARWLCGQQAKNRTITDGHYFGGGEHVTYIAYEDLAAFNRACTKLSGLKECQPVDWQLCMQIKQEMLKSYLSREEYIEGLFARQREERELNW